MAFDDLRAFLIVAQHGSFYSAAVALGVSRTTLRRQVDALEARAGVALFKRVPRGVELTDAGRRLARTGRTLDEQFNAVLRAVRENGRRPEGEVRLLIENGLAPQALAAIYGLFRASWPDLKMHARFQEAPLTANLANVDVVVWFGRSQPGRAWETHTVMPVPLRLLASRAYLEARGTPRTARDLASHDLLCWVTPADPAPRIMTRDGATRAVAPIMTSTSVDVLHHCARLGLGIAWAPDGGLSPPPGEGPLVGVLEEQFGGELPLRLAVPLALAKVPKVRVIIDNLEAVRALAASS
jgi:DNA-binding transcriptional LysR family regulator